MVDTLRVGSTDFNNIPAAPPAAHTIALRTAREICDLPDPPDSDMLLGPLVVRGARTIIVGDTGHGKTSLALQLSTAVLAGKEALGYTGAGAGPVLVVDLEQGQRSIKRVLRENELQERDDLYYAAVPDGLELDTNAEHKNDLERIVVNTQPAVMILDPYYKAHRADSNEERAIVDLMRFLDELRTAYGFALLLPAHPRKQAAANQTGGARKLELSDVFGSSAITRGAELVIAVERLAHGYARLRFLKDRDHDLPVGDHLPLLFSKETGFRIDDRPSPGDRDLETEIAEYLDEHPMTSTNKIAEAIGAGKQRVASILKTSDKFTFQKGSNNTRFWVPSKSQNHSGHPEPPAGQERFPEWFSPVRGEPDREPAAAGDPTSSLNASPNRSQPAMPDYDL